MFLNTVNSKIIFTKLQLIVFKMVMIFGGHSQSASTFCNGEILLNQRSCSISYNVIETDNRFD